MSAYISTLLLTKNRPSALCKLKACGVPINQLTNRRPGRASFLAYHTLCTCQSSDLSSHFLMRIGLDKPEVRAKGINHPKHAVEAACACLKRESASCVYLWLIGSDTTQWRCKEGTGRATSRYNTYFDSIRRHGGRLNLEGNTKEVALRWWRGGQPSKDKGRSRDRGEPLLR
jgi:hypothetical protein